MMDQKEIRSLQALGSMLLSPTVRTAHAVGLQSSLMTTSAHHSIIPTLCLRTLGHVLTLFLSLPSSASSPVPSCLDSPWPSTRLVRTPFQLSTFRIAQDSSTDATRACGLENPPTDIAPIARGPLQVGPRSGPLPCSKELLPYLDYFLLFSFLHPPFSASPLYVLDLCPPFPSFPFYPSFPFPILPHPRLVSRAPSHI